MKKPEKICSGERPGYRRWLKRLRRRQERRLWRVSGEYARLRPIYRGWSI